jgi:hypothetical protein
MTHWGRDDLEWSELSDAAAEFLVQTSAAGPTKCVGGRTYVRFMTEVSGADATGSRVVAREFADLLDGCWALATSEETDPGDPRAQQAALIDEVRFWEELKAVAAARQARATTSFAKLRRENPRAVPGSDDSPKRSLNAEIALARRDFHASVAPRGRGRGTGARDASHDGSA